MSRNTPAQTLQYAETFDQDDGLFAGPSLATLTANLDVLRELLDAPDAKRDFSPVYALNRFNAPVRLPDALRAEVEQLLVRVMEASASHKVAVEEGLLRNLAFTASPDSLPLFARLLDYTRSRDQFTTKRRAWSIAAIALLAKRHRADAEAAREVPAGRARQAIAEIVRGTYSVPTMCGEAATTSRLPVRSKRPHASDRRWRTSGPPLPDAAVELTSRRE